ncbi:hypothetical protein D0862_02498 [Hortaea werneckii]|uniref:Uncharacterized protein n=1 Tax=Hortaea werneckii TaxID=91943 RepID=A0A3M7HI17_HORWE|nr:hypothetical protein D0862_02498 [Hortaea werneckii]
MPSPSFTIRLLSIFLAFSQPAQASVQTAAAIGIGVGLGVCLFAAIAGFTYLKYSRRVRREREAAAAAGPEVSANEIIAMHDRAAPKGFNIWDEMMSLTTSLPISSTYVRRSGCAVKRPTFGVFAGISSPSVALSQQSTTTEMSTIRFASAYDQHAVCYHLRASA